MRSIPGALRFALRVLALNLAVATVVIGQSNSTSVAPKGYVVLARVGRGAALFTTKEDQSAETAAVACLHDLTAIFGKKMAVGKAIGDEADHQCQAFFKATVDGKAVQGTVTVGIGAGQAAISVIYAPSDSSPAERAKLMAAIPDASHWKSHPLPGGSGTIRLPQGWKITDSNNLGTVIAMGPKGETIGLGVSGEVLTPYNFLAAQARANGTMLVAPYTDPQTALRNIAPQLSRMSVRRGGPSVHLDEILSSKPARPQLPNGRAALIYCRLTRNTAGKVEHMKQWTRFECYPVGATAWGFYTSYIAVDEAQFDKELPEMLQICKSWKLNDNAIYANTAQNIHVQNQRFDAFEGAMREEDKAFDSYLKATQTDEKISEKCNDNFDEMIRGTRTVEDTVTGEKTDVNLGYSKEIVNKLNQHAGYKRYKEIPLRDQF